MNLVKKLPKIMFNPDLLEEDDSWCKQCFYCETETQGGRPGLVAHMFVVHGLFRKKKE
jgi:hypothetical protein